MTPLARVRRDEAVAAVDRVVDPCSAAMGLPIGLAELGLATVHVLDSAEAQAQAQVRVRLRLTSPCCAYGPTMAGAIEQELTALEWVRSASVEIDHAAMWTESRIAPEAAARLAMRRSTTIAVTGVQPYEWTRDQKETARD